MRKNAGLLIFVLSITLSGYSQEDELFINAVYKDFLQNTCDSFLLYVPRENLIINTYIESEFKKVLPKKIVKEIFTASQEKLKNREWDLSLLKNVIPVCYHDIHNKEKEFIEALRIANETFDKTFGLDTIDNIQLVDSLTKTVMNSGNNLDHFNKIPSCFRQVYKFSRPLFSKNRDYAVIDFTNHRWILNSSGFIAVYKLKKGKWIQIAKINSWVS